MNKYRRYALSFSIITIIGVGLVVSAYSLIFTVPETAQIVLYNKLGNIAQMSADERHIKPNCYNYPSTVAVDDNEQINLLVWNIYKQNRINWQSELTRFSQQKQLILLQEASLTAELKTWITKGEWQGYQVNAFEAFNTSSGVLNLSKHSPLQVCAYTALEPWLRLPKSALYALYPLTNGEQLAIINLHAINFTVGVEAYQQQLAKLLSALESHQGPMIVAGDFNSWNQQRLEVIQQQLAPFRLQEVIFTPDNRFRFINGLALDAVFYRGLELVSADTSITAASDHNPLSLRFNLIHHSER